MAEERSAGDPNTLSNPEQCVVTHMDIHLDVDFQKHVLKGYVDLIVERKDIKADLFLDTRDLTITNVRNKNNMNRMNFELHKPDELFGTALEIKLPKRGAKKGTLNIRVEYETSPKARALQWLEPCQTAGKKHPYMFSQCQAINARTIIPCQDTPSVKVPFSATIVAPKELTVLMSAISEGAEEDGSLKKFKFIQKVPTPSYLIAIVVGDLESRKIGPRSHVWSEKGFVDEAAEEFSDTQTMVDIAEDLLGEYAWGIYDLLVLPPSFAFGGMENPCLTFLTPTIIAGDKSLVDVIAHEISHSWTGNLVTNRNFEHFWLNEGFTTFMERKILARMHGESCRHFDAIIGWQDLEYAVATEEPRFTKLVTDLRESDPDDCVTKVPYEKGHTFLFYLEQLLGGPEVFEKFLKSYIEEFKFKSIDTEVWKSYLYKYFSDKEEVLNTVDWNTWFFAPGMPPVKPEYDCSLQKTCEDLYKSWLKADENDLSAFAATDINKFSFSQITEFLSLMIHAEPLPIKKIEKMNEVYKLGETRNSEIRSRWIQLGIRAKWPKIVPAALKFVNEQGRMYYVRPIYKGLFEWEEVRDQAISNFQENCSEMMYVTAHRLRRDMNLCDDEAEKD